MASEHDDARRMDSETAQRFAHLETMLTEILRELRGRRTRAAKRTRTIRHQRVAEVTYKPTDIDVAKAKKIMKRLGMKT
jgi:hypothetical protein